MSLLDDTPGLVRVAASAWLRTLSWTAQTSLAAARSVLGEEPPAPEPPAAPAPPRAPTLRERGADLLSRSADLDAEEEAHPAYAQILDQLATDEARILRHLCTDGAQPAVDVRVGKVPLIGSELVAPGLSMIGAGAGVRHLDRVPAHLTNLSRLGLNWFSREPLGDPLAYQVLEAQPDVLEAMRASGRGARTVRRSILLTPFGADFCRVCLP